MSTEETAYPLVLGGGLQVADVDFAKAGGLVPGVVQDARTAEVLMVGFLDADALGTTLRTGLATFRSRSRGGLWTKGETSGNTLRVVSVDVDCDRDTLLIHALPAGPTCHTGDRSCFDAARGPRAAAEGPVDAGSAHGTGTFLPVLDAVVANRRAALPEGSYTTRLFTDGVRRIAQKVGEEGVETALAGVVQDDEALLGESADLLYHLIVLLRARDLSLADVEDVLRRRHG
ncbi:bifunctional phosphoribosyl-AMP cyclohydrolase/phosphoribosyl-ATP diphosphatase [Ornithinimicrobium sp. CNJ-824]|uniref:bifunctional phosphoribosyl-AMP cyclohydrolase/phosphoribosyl-ATP diphosphatase HisIE n=1 Tax=Ornithinimicrobium sp. CNJ-824 TaxID=1904966 RepID=UPI00096107B5|nr:bifunctional phosphoribosyl-AMP cyclohydrolase/phosphoribosyl-ATP diphosphatase HisIE [Ornithinimicrobium sp. CNJ-824]OLT22583.1 bifunctional phosphoribosyl-AMP cyclohydrolase/phosphoribosyl-ATP diphosphatase [Ornithinimicrobium sp. CNJ-824]